MRTESKVRLVYVAGKFSAKTREGVEANIAAAVAVGIEVAKLGLFPVVPHANTSHPDYERVQEYPFWIAGTLELLRRCDAIVMVPRWEESSGAKGERAEASRLRMPTFDTVAELAASVGHRSSPFAAGARDDDRPTDPAPPLSVEAFHEVAVEDDEADRMVGLARGVVG